jgi:Na+/phosphate symporter
MEYSGQLLGTLAATARDVLPIAAILFGFQVFVLRRPIRNLRAVLVGFGLVLLGLALFLRGLEQALFPLGRMMAEQLTASEFIYHGAEQLPASLHWTDYAWVYAFAAAIGFATTIAEPSLIAVAIKASQVSAGTITVWGLRLAVAVGVAVAPAADLRAVLAGLAAELDLDRSGTEVLDVGHDEGRDAQPLERARRRCRRSGCRQQRTRSEASLSERLRRVLRRPSA